MNRNLIGAHCGSKGTSPRYSPTNLNSIARFPPSLSLPLLSVCVVIVLADEPPEKNPRRFVLCRSFPSKGPAPRCPSNPTPPSHPVKWFAIGGGDVVLGRWCTHPGCLRSKAPGRKTSGSTSVELFQALLTSPRVLAFRFGPVASMSTIPTSLSVAVSSVAACASGIVERVMDVLLLHPGEPGMKNRALEPEIGRDDSRRFSAETRREGRVFFLASVGRGCLLFEGLRKRGRVYEGKGSVTW